MSMRKLYTLGIALLLIGQTAMAQSAAITVPYVMGFEEADSLELKNWVLNPGANAGKCTDQWVVGEAVKSEGRRALYISADGGVHARFGVAKNVQYVYRDLILPKGTYEVSFDWSCIGSTDAVMYAGIGIAQNLNVTASNLSAVIPANVETLCKQRGAFSGNSMWKNSSIKFSSNGARTYRLFFVWSSSNEDSLNTSLSGCIDNVQICSAKCPKPTQVTINTDLESSDVTASWEGTSSEYQLEYRAQNGAWNGPYTTDITQYTVGHLTEGVYTFRVRGICGSDTSAYAYADNYSVYYPSEHCINYTDFKSPSVSCTYGTVSDPYENFGAIDDGEDRQSSRHTVNTRLDAFDPLIGTLRTIPSGELRSIRLGNRNGGAEGEAIIYHHVVDLQHAPILLFKYAIASESVEHAPQDEPRFSIEIFDLDTAEQLFPCKAKRATFFTPDNNTDGEWQQWPTGVRSGGLWKDWTSLGVNLRSAGVEDGDAIEIRITNRDCAYGAHIGYAYFTIGCANCTPYQMTDNSCNGTPVSTFEAPDGFYYQWYAASNPDNILSRERVFHADGYDDSEFRVDVIRKDSGDTFTLSAYAVSMTPIPNPMYKVYQRNCKNYVQLTDSSYVRTRDYKGAITEHSTLPIEFVEWDLGAFGRQEGKSASSFEIELPSAGGTFPISFTAYAGNCDSTTTMEIAAPALSGDTAIELRSVTEKELYIYVNGEMRLIDHDTTLIAFEGKNMYGCDSMHILQLQFATPVADILTEQTGNGNVYVVPCGSMLPLPESVAGEYLWSTLLGQRVAAGTLYGYEHGIPVPAAAGNYVLTIHTDKSDIIKRVIAI